MKKIAVIPNTKKDASLSLTKNIIDVLCSAGAEVILSSELESFGLNAEYMSHDKLFDSAELAVTVGGDGTILGVAEAVSENEIPVIGVNLGRMGFMAELEPDEIQLLTNILYGNYSIEKRMMLDVCVMRGGETVFSHRALNDIVVSKGSVSKIAELELYCNSTYVSRFNSDGLIVSTPTGSTAYSLSAGGAIIDPTIDCMLLTPVCPHSFINARPIVFSPKSVLEIKDIQSGEENTYLTVDGRINEQITFSDIVRVVASKKTTNLIKLKDGEFYNRVYQKISEKK